jgi:hypothetical protein
MHVCVDLTHEVRFVTLLHLPTGRPFFSAPMDAGPCSACARSTFLFHQTETDRMCNTCCGQLQGVVVMASPHGYGAFAVAASSASFPEPHIDPPLPLESGSDTSVVFRVGDVACEMGGRLVGVTDLDAAYGELGTPYAAACTPHAALDSTLVRNAAAYINSVRGATPAPNLRMYAAEGGIVVVALADIHHGEELLVDYGPDFPWDVACRVSEEPGPFTTEVRHGRAVHLIR